jgi:hypothetical protein
MVLILKVSSPPYKHTTSNLKKEGAINSAKHNRKVKWRPGAVTHACNPSYLEIEGLQSQASPRKKVSDILPQRISQEWWQESVIPTMQEV